MGRHRKKSNKKNQNQNNHPEVQRPSSTYHNYYRPDNKHVGYQYNNSDGRAFHYTNNPVRFYGRYNYFAPRREREPSPLNGSEEYTQRKIQETSDMIKRQLMSPDNCLPDTSTTSLLEEKLPTENTNSKSRPTRENRKSRRKPKKKEAEKSSNSSVQKPHITYNVREIHDQIMNHISNLNYGRKQNLINSDNSGYDAAIQQIYKQKSLELSKALRVMSRQEKPEASEIVNSIIPDFAIKFEELPIHIIRELSTSFEELDRNIGIVDENTPYDLRNQCIENLRLENYSTYHFSPPDERNVHLNSEGVDSIKEENVVETRIKLEPLDIIVLPDSEDEGNLHPCEIKEEITFDDEFRENNFKCSKTIEQSIGAENHSNVETYITPQNLIQNEILDLQGIDVQSNNVPEDRSSYQPPPQINFQIGTNQESNAQNNLVPEIPRIRINANIFELASESLYDTVSHKDNITVDNTTSSENHCNFPDIIVHKKPEEKIPESNLCNIIAHEKSEKRIPECNVTNDIVHERAQKKIPEYNIAQEPEQKTPKSNHSNIIVQEKPEKIPERNNIVPERPAKKTEQNSKSDECNTKIQSCSRSKDYTSNEKNVYISVKIKRKKTPVNLKEATEMMFEFDKEIENLTKLRQSIISDLNENPKQKKQGQKNGQAKRKLNHEDNKNPKKKKTSSSNQTKTKTSNDVIKEPWKNPDYNFELDDLPDVIVICKVLTSLGVLLVGTLGGMLQYFDLFESKMRRTVYVYKSRITCLECECVRNERLIFTTTSEQPELTILNYHTMAILRRIRLEDGVQAVCNSWKYFFIGGSRGYLTRFNWETNKIEFEDPISTSDKIVDLKATTEGARKILLVLFSDSMGSCQIHVRDAMSGLHIRILGDCHKAESLILHLNFAIISSAEGINMYNFCDGQFKAKLALNGVTKLCFLGNLLLAQFHNGINIYDLKKKERLGSLSCNDISSILPLHNKIIVGTTTNKLKTLTLPEEYLKMI